MFNVMRTFSAQISGQSTADLIQQNQQSRMKQDAMLKGGTTVPQFSERNGSSNLAIQGMAAKIAQSDANNTYASCTGKAASTCGGRRRRKRTRRLRKYKMKKY
jgi:hypothetical protein